MGVGQCELRRHAGTKQPERALAHAGFPLRIARNNRDFFAVAEGSDRAYGIDIPRKGMP